MINPNLDIGRDREADLHDAKLQGANLVRAKMQRSELIVAKLQGAQICGG